MARKETKVLSKSIMSIGNLLDDVQKESSFGLFTQVSPNLDSLAIHALLTDVTGKVKSHLTKKYDFRSLFYTNFTGTSENGLYLHFNVDSQQRLSDSLVHFPYSHMSLVVIGFTEPVAHFGTKKDLKVLGTRKANGQLALKVDAITLKSKGYDLKFPLSVEYLFANSHAVSPLVNSETLEYKAGDVTLRKLPNGKWKAHIPIFIDLDFVTPKAAVSNQTPRPPKPHASKPTRVPVNPYVLDC